MEPGIRIHIKGCVKCDVACLEGDAHIWTGVNPPSVSYLATWQYGNDKLVSCNAYHIPGADAHQRCTSGLNTVQQAANQSTLSGSFLVTSFTSNAFSFFFQRQPDTELLRSENAITGVNGSRVSNRFPLRPWLFGPSAVEGVRHVNMTRRETSSGRSCSFT